MYKDLPRHRRVEDHFDHGDSSSVPVARQRQVSTNLLLPQRRSTRGVFTLHGHPARERPPRHAALYNCVNERPPQHYLLQNWEVCLQDFGSGNILL